VSREPCLVLTPRLPWPLDDGGKIAAWQSVWSAAQEFETILVSLHDPALGSPPAPREVAECGIEVVEVPFQRVAVPLAAWRGLAGRWPYTLERYRSHALARTLRRLVQERRPAFAFVNHLHLGPYVDDLRPVPMILREHNVESLWMSRYADAQPRGPRRMYAQYQARRLRDAERILCHRASMVLAIQDEEAERLRALSPSADVRTLPLGIDFSSYPDPRPESPPIVLLAGAFGWEPTAAGALRFLETGWPALRQAAPTARLRIAGKDPPPALVERARQTGAEVTGYVASMRDELARATMLLVPLWEGAGVRVKIIEAFAARLPVVSTPLGAEGLDLEPGEQYLQSDTPEGIAAAAAKLLAWDDRGRAMAVRAHGEASKRWSLPAVAALQNRLCREAVASRRA
jgi:glycosyltransferase involved in cell wall biosynthesis